MRYFSITRAPLILPIPMLSYPYQPPAASVQLHMLLADQRNMAPSRDEEHALNDSQQSAFAYRLSATGKQAQAGLRQLP